MTGNINSTCSQRRAQPGSRSTSPVLPLGHPRGEPPLLTPGVSYQGHPETTSIRGWRRGSARPQQHPGHPGAAEGPAGGGLQSGAERRGRRQEAARSFWRPAAGGRGLAAAPGPVRRPRGGLPARGVGGYPASCRAIPNKILAVSRSSAGSVLLPTPRGRSRAGLDVLVFSVYVG